MLEKICFPHLGMDPLDREHREIIFFLHQVKGNDNPIKVARTFIGYFMHHCNHEEEFMRELNYPQGDLLEHQAQHQKLRDFFKETMMHPEVDSEERAQEAIEKARLNLIAHINVWDARLAAWVFDKVG